MILLIDNYDSFTFNLVHFLGDVGARCEVVRNDKLTVADALARDPEAIVVSPGPCTPNEAGVCLDLIVAAAGKIPILGVCLGHQAVGQAFGGEVVRAPLPMHGKLSAISHSGPEILEGVPSPFSATRYHSLIVARETLPEVLIPTAWTDDGLIMAMHHRDFPIHGVQFHPESIASEHGHRILANFLAIARFSNSPGVAKNARRPEPRTGMPQDLKPILGKLAGGETMSVEDAEAAFTVIMSGDATPAQIGALLMAMRLRGETVPEITGAVRAMRARMTAIAAPDDAIDVCGTGGDGAGTLNVSSAVTFVVAALGVPVAKHGNRALSSRTGGADVLTALGVNIDAPMERLPAILREAGAVFLFAPRHHPSMRHAAGPRVELGTRTIFNILGPLSNPARVKRQLTGVFSAEWTRPMAETLAALGCESAWLVHGLGLDELTVAGDNQVTALHDGSVHTFSVAPEDAGLTRAPIAAIKGGDAVFNADALLGVLRGSTGAYRDTVLLNSAAALIVAHRAADLRDGVDQAGRAITSGAALHALETMRRVSAAV